MEIGTTNPPNRPSSPNRSTQDPAPNKPATSQRKSSFLVSGHGRHCRASIFPRYDAEDGVRREAEDEGEGEGRGGRRVAAKVLCRCCDAAWEAGADGGWERGVEGVAGG